MYERVAALLVGALYLYSVAGLVFAIAFVTTGVKRIDSQAIGSGVGFRVLIFRGSAALWPLLLRRWVSGTGEPQEERNTHRWFSPTVTFIVAFSSCLRCCYLLFFSVALLSSFH